MTSRFGSTKESKADLALFLYLSEVKIPLDMCTKEGISDDAKECQGQEG